jgi:hypothetical protein
MSNDRGDDFASRRLRQVRWQPRIVDEAEVHFPDWDDDGSVARKREPAPKVIDVEAAEPAPKAEATPGVFSRRGLGASPDLSKLVGRSAELLRDADAVAAMPTEAWPDEDVEDEDESEAADRCSAKGSGSFGPKPQGDPHQHRTL